MKYKSFLIGLLWALWKYCTVHDMSIIVILCLQPQSTLYIFHLQIPIKSPKDNVYLFVTDISESLSLQNISVATHLHMQLTHLCVNHWNLWMNLSPVNTCSCKRKSPPHTCPSLRSTHVSVSQMLIQKLSSWCVPTPPSLRHYDLG